MNKTLLMTATIASLAVNVMAANNNTLVGTDNNITATSHSSLVSGYQNTIDANNALAFGTNNTVTGENGFVGGNNATAAGRNSFAFGSHAESLVEYTVAIGNQARTASYDSVAIGNGAFVSGESSVAFGRTNNVTGENSVAIGANNGTVAGGQSAVVGYNNKIGADKEQLVFGSNSESSGQGALVFGTHSKAVAMDAVAFGNNTIADKSNAVAIGTNSVTDDAVGVEGITINGTKHVFAGEQPASVVSFGAKARAGAGGVTQYNRQLTNVSAGQISADSLDAVNGSQLFAAIDEIETNAKQISKNKQNIKDVAIGLNMLGDVVNDHEQAIVGNTTAIANNTARVNGNASAINGNTSAINSLGQKVSANTADIRSLEHVADNHEGRITTLENRSLGLANDINNKVNNLGQRVNKLGASSAALAGLHPLEYNKNDKGSFAISYGHYRNANAIALGAFYSPNEKVRLGFGITLGGETQFNINAAFRTGRGSEYEPQAKNGELEQLRQEVETLKALVNK
ncbi:MAG: YadA-like family protein [Veillonella sp.]|uniref:YadA-like family protein n=1 Tax=Veillonella sp. TaxID=1926307 RepID=UPI002912EDA5|nr:YadA-like family protein [Veillonella sp.]MDU5735429.1 YadA-like family protein [Veillonella sp.]MDU5834702.1 YadA-like family protein [Veillonella sp.]